MTTNSEMVKVAEWSDSLGLRLFPPKYKRVRLDNEFENKTYIVTSILVRASAEPRQLGIATLMRF